MVETCSRELWRVAENSVRENCVNTAAGPLVTAGAHQFKTFWVRDFCYAVPGLLEVLDPNLVRHQLALALQNTRSDGLVARGFDVVNPKARVLAATCGLETLDFFSFAAKPLKAEYLGEHGTPAADSNLLVLLACMQWSERTGDPYFFEHHEGNLKKIFAFSCSSRNGPLLEQPPFSDWQDSARRNGATFYLNLLFLRVLRKLQRAKFAWALPESVENCVASFWNSFYCPEHSLFRSQIGRDQFSLETQLWCIEEDLFARYLDRKNLWESLRRSPLWGEGLPGRAVWPPYPASEVSWTTKLVGLRHYHDQFYWSWLMAESMKVAKIMGAQADVAALMSELAKLAKRHNTIHEIYEKKEALRPVRRPFYRSEFPFTWGAAKILEALRQK